MTWASDNPWWMRKAVAGIAGLMFFALCALLGGALAYCIAMPGDSYAGSLPSPSAEQARLAEDLERHVRALSVDIGVRRARRGDSLRKAEDYVRSQLDAAGAIRDVHATKQRLGLALGNPANVILDIPGKASGPVVLVGAHYDSAAETPGANDNATGAAAALVLAHGLVQASTTLPIRIVLFANEEPPYFQTGAMGSLQHAARCRREGIDLRAVLSLETMGYYSDEPGSQRYPDPLSWFYPDRGNFIGFVGDLGSRALVREVLGLFRNHAKFPSEGAALPRTLPGVGWSDHWSFWQYDYPAIMITDTAPFRDPHYHQRSDTIDHIDFDKLARVVDGLQRVVIDLASSEKL